ncbi:hypothetical protein E2C01_056719 [Portunus trituberculatus]|uniref:Uncharacterized protein n=1 Tax=Portunus trituberculatus TaxID=210409 RepID=A0A5B7GRK6_PORTR|nr:hypothetical protein [Portunus trituberculatus]
MSDGGTDCRCLHHAVTGGILSVTDTFSLCITPLHQVRYMAIFTAKLTQLFTTSITTLEEEANGAPILPVNCGDVPTLEESPLFPRPNSHFSLRREYHRLPQPTAAPQNNDNSSTLPCLHNARLTHP